LIFVKGDIDKVSKQKKTKDFQVCLEFEALDEERIVHKGSKFDMNKLRDPEQLVILALLLQDAIPIRNRQWGNKTFRNVFKGVDAVNWLVEDGGAKSVEDALEIGEILREEGIIKVVAKEGDGDQANRVEKFSNTWNFYRFSSIETDEYVHEMEEIKMEEVVKPFLTIDDDFKKPCRHKSERAVFDDSMK